MGDKQSAINIVFDYYDESSEIYSSEDDPDVQDGISPTDFQIENAIIEASYVCDIESIEKMCDEFDEHEIEDYLRHILIHLIERKDISSFYELMKTGEVTLDILQDTLIELLRDGDFDEDELEESENEVYQMIVEITGMSDDEDDEIEDEEDAA